MEERLRDIVKWGEAAARHIGGMDAAQFFHDEEGYQLLKIKEDILEYLSEGARQHLITAFWEYLIYLEIAYKLLEKDRWAHRLNNEIHDAYIKLSGAYNAENFSAEGDFSERLATLSSRLADRYQEKYGRQDGWRRPERCRHAPGNAQAAPRFRFRPQTRQRRCFGLRPTTFICLTTSTTPR